MANWPLSRPPHPRLGPAQSVVFAQKACNKFNATEQKQNHTRSGRVTKEDIDYARQDVKCTTALLNAMKREFDRHPIDLLPEKAYSPRNDCQRLLGLLGSNGHRSASPEVSICRRRFRASLCRHTTAGGRNVAFVVLKCRWFRWTSCRICHGLLFAWQLRSHYCQAAVVRGRNE
jgi:hypothetical protein